MTEIDARRLWLVRAFEAPLTPPWSEADAVWASDEARRQLGSQAALEEWAARRAELALERLGGRSVALKAAMAEAIRPGLAGGAWVGLVAAVAFLVGLFADSVGRRAEIDLLSLPLLALLGWNLLVFAGLMLTPLVRMRPGARQAARGLRAATAAALRWATGKASAIRVAGRVPAPPAQGAHEAATAWLPALARFQASWSEIAGPAWRAQAAAALHLAAAGLAAGAVAGLYLRGLVLAYRASWDSTFLEAPQALALLQVLLGPASLVTGLDLPSAPGFEALRASAGGSESAARWIHLWSATLGMVVVLPRLVLAGACFFRARRAARQPALPWFEDAWLMRLAAQHRTGPLDLVVVPYRTAVDEPARQRLREAVRRSVGSEPRIRWQPTLAEAGEPPAPEPTADGSWPVTLALLSARQTPERETHGRFLGRLRAQAPKPALAPLMLVDEAGFGARLAPQEAAERRAERRRAWEGLADELGLPLAFVDLGVDGGAAPASAPAIETLARHLLVPALPGS